MAERLLAAALAVASGEMKMGWRAGQARARLQVEDTGSGDRRRASPTCRVFFEMEITVARLIHRFSDPTTD